MKQSGFFTRMLSVLLAFCFMTGTLCFGNGVTLAADTQYSNMSSDEKRIYLENKLKEVEAKLNTLGSQSKETEEYINTLDEKISYLKNQLELDAQTVESSKAKITALEKQYSDNEAEIEQLGTDIKELEVKKTELQAEFNESYKMYAQRAKAMYVSGQASTLAALLTCDDLATLLTRVEMIVRVTRADGNLLSSLLDEGDDLKATQTSLEEKQKTLTDTQIQLEKNKEELDKTIIRLEAQQKDLAVKQTQFEEQKKESDELLIKLQTQTGAYSEERNQDLRELQIVNAEIEEAAERYRRQMEERTTTTTTTTTQRTTQGQNTTKATTKATTASSRLSLTYPVPAYTRITTAYGSAGYAGHTGVDFACPTGSRVVAAESGTVIISKDITTAPYAGARTVGGYYSYGRYIVIAHDKKDSSGNYVYTLYAHNSSRLVSEGDYVSKGETIAYSGETGNTYGPHCHFEVRTPNASYGSCVNPTIYLP